MTACPSSYLSYSCFPPWIAPRGNLVVLQNEDKRFPKLEILRQSLLTKISKKIVVQEAKILEMMKFTLVVPSWSPETTRLTKAGTFFTLR